MHSLGTNRNASRVMKQLSPYLNSFQDVEKIYYLNKAGRARTGATKVINKTVQYKHTLMKNDIYLFFSCKELIWRDEFTINCDVEGSFVADACFIINGQYYFLEVDHKQKMSTNIHKLNRYFRFMKTERWQKNNKSGTFPILLFYTASENRKVQLQEANPGLDLQVITTTDLY